MAERDKVNFFGEICWLDGGYATSLTSDARLGTGLLIVKSVSAVTDDNVLANRISSGEPPVLLRRCY